MSQVTLQQLLKAMVEQDASDLHLTVGSPPVLRISGTITKVKTPPLSSADTKNLCYGVLTDAQKSEFEQNWEIDVSFGIKGLARFRGNIFFQRGSVAGAFRRIPFEIPTMSALGLPQVVEEMIRAPNGLILVTGPTGSGKSTTIASIVDHLNQTQKGHIISLEDPIEFMHPHKSCVVNQREIGSDSKSFTSAMKRILRQDPDYVLIGELRDQESIEMALTIAETGHLVFGTLHTNSAVQTINRLINIFSAERQNQIRQLVSFVMVGSIAQQLVQTKQGGRVLVMEILRSNNAVKNLIRESKTEMVYSVMQTNQEETGMQTMNQSLFRLVEQGKLDEDGALEYSTVPDEFLRMINQQAGGPKPPGKK
jgi:twitching motility protein PilT